MDTNAAKIELNNDFKETLLPVEDTHENFPVEP
jgi:hypothetical protein